MKYLSTLIFFLICQLTNAQNWQLVWSDEFNGTSLDETNWSYDIGTGAESGLIGWGNNELQYYTDSPDNVYVQGGNLHLRAIEENFGGMNYTSGKIKSLNKRFWTYAKIEARLKVPEGQGMWPAFWMLPEGQFWPGEIDIMENVGYAPTTVWGTTHQGTVDDVYSVGGQLDTGVALADDFHTYSIEWYEDNIKWYFDDILYYELNRSEIPPQYEWLFAQDYYLILNVAVGGNWPGSPDATTQFPQEMVVDYVRVYEYAPETNNVTFQVDMSEAGIAPDDMVYVNGTFNDWCGLCNPMTNTGNGVWETTIALPPGIHEYKFTTNGWNGLIEGFFPGMPCVLQTGTQGEIFINRYVNVGFDDTMAGPYCFNSCDFCASNPTGGCDDPDASNFNPDASFNDGSCLYPTTFFVDVSDLDLFPGELVNLNGTFNDWCGNCIDMSDVDGNDVWEVTVDLPVGTHEYKFTTNGWFGNVEFFAVGEPCTNTTYAGQDVFTNRVFEQIASPMQLEVVCFNACAACPVDNVPVTFKVDAANSGAQDMMIQLVSNDLSGIFPMQYQGWNAWSISVILTTNQDIQYHFIADGVDETVIGGCAVNGERVLSIGQEPLDLPFVCIDECQACAGCTDPFSINYNPIAANDDALCLEDLIPGCTYNDASNYNSMANDDDGSCVFEVNTNDCPSDFNGDQIVNASDLLEFLSAFGTFCE